MHLTQEFIPYADEYLAISTVVDFGECLEDFVEMYKVNRHWIVSRSPIFESIKNCIQQNPLGLEEMEELLANLCQQSIHKIMIEKKEELKTIPLRDWLDKLRESRI